MLKDTLLLADETLELESPRRPKRAKLDLTGSISWDQGSGLSRPSSITSSQSSASLDGYGEEDPNHPFEDGYLTSLLEKETDFMVDPLYFDKIHPLCRPESRKIVVNWMIENGERMRLQSSTVAIAVNLFDRFMASTSVPPSTIKLFSSMALHIATKFNESVHLPLARYEAAVGATAQQLARVEIYMLEHVAFRLCAITPHEVLRCLTVQSPSAVRGSSSTHEMLLDLAMMDSAFLRFRPSLIASATISVAEELFSGQRVELPHPTISAAIGNKHHSTEFIACVLALRQAYSECVGTEPLSPSSRLCI
mmetsp:Transcript_9723/g.19828  ORF Transcript_9723/g.19828 Transcript_9723/m.19828 type:complete len:308 (-) Transcript_9723:2413-3336(-)|eukprot:CAMPEP_0184687180 /NCGR_PEP_ID=MMETSP0312-20130426/25453_1 /TAXON_ID=31354 /ORGANISM="Compsopogon coeruleus, Strain SAG 36.94" /LENGTH=307 /DNA_ID=CAMNT_0027143019 /DNA_START=162 /DNA_END=1085 /DNA_ORIENTATION=+